MGHHLIGYFYLLTFIIGFGAITFVLTNPQFLDARGGLLGGGNMAAIHLANAVAATSSSASSRRWPSRPSSPWWPA